MSTAAAAAVARPARFPPPPPSRSLQLLRRSLSPSSPSRFIPDRVFEVRLASSGPIPGWGGGAWCLLRVSSQGGGGGGSGGGGGEGGGSEGGLSLDSDECSPRRVVAAPWSRVSGDPRPLRTSRALAQGAGVAVSARWSSGDDEQEEGDETTFAVGGVGDEEEIREGAPPKPKRKKKLPPLQTLRLVGMSPDAAADLCLEIRSRVAAAASEQQE